MEHHDDGNGTKAASHAKVNGSLKLLTPEADVDARNERPHDEENDANKIQAKPYRLDLLRMADQCVIGCREAETHSCGEQKNAQDGIIAAGDVRVLAMERLEDVGFGKEKGHGGKKVRMDVDQFIV